MIFDRIAMPLELQCKDQGLDFKKAFPEPPGMEALRNQMRQQIENQRLQN